MTSGCVAKFVSNGFGLRKRDSSFHRKQALAEAGVGIQNLHCLVLGSTGFHLSME